MTRDQHISVSNQPAEQVALAAEQAIFQPPSEGVAGAGAPAGTNGLEQVEGYVRPEYDRMPAELWTPPTAELPDIGVASFGPPPPVAETVHGPDDRVQITNTADYPWRANASLRITAANGDAYIATAWFIGPHTLATAGHVVFINHPGHPDHGWVQSIQVMPGRNGATLPFGSVTSTNFRSVKGWTESGGDENYDYGAIIIPTELGSTTGWFGFGAWPDADLLKTTANISGYPGDKPPGTQWFDARGISSVNPLKVYYDIDTAGGQSGSAVFSIVDGNRYGIAVHAYGGATVNSGTRITQPVYDNLVAWKA
ncbi:endopeptidase [Streptomyces sp. NPDC046881]|uniref:trypsin-like serine peptidase n=1 Tax=Streptomyces sp. NPDC046881 TaxID=3155374 RepID=UPI0033CC1AE0